MTVCRSRTKLSKPIVPGGRPWADSALRIGRAEVDRLRVRQDRGPRPGRARERRRHDVRIEPEEDAADDAAERDADVVDAVGVEIRVRIAVGEVQAGQRALQRDRVGDRLANVIARVQRVARRSISASRCRSARPGANTPVAPTLSRLKWRSLLPNGLRPLVERARRVRDAVQRQVDGDDGESGLRERVRDRRA